MAINDLAHEEQIEQLQQALRREQERVTLAEKQAAYWKDAAQRGYAFTFAGKKPDRNERGV